jgi:hypothetical protein
MKKFFKKCVMAARGANYFAIFFFASAFLGVSAGSFYFIFTGGAYSAKIKPLTDALFSAYLLQGAPRFEVFKISFLENLKVAALVGLSGISIIFLPVLLFENFIKSFKFAAGVAFFTGAYGFGGFLISLVLFLQSAILILMFLIYSSLIAREPLFKIKEKRLAEGKKFLKQIIWFLMVLGIIALVSFLNAYITPEIGGLIYEISNCAHTKIF